MITQKANIRRFTSKDARNIRDLIDSIMTDEFGDSRDAYPTQDLDDLTQNYGALGEAFFVAVLNEKIIGTVAVKKEDDRIALLRRLFVAKSFRRQKIGADLIDYAIQFCHDVGYQEVVFKTTSKMHSAIEACKRKGFVQRAKLQLGTLELLKFAKSIRDGVKVHH